MMKLVFLALALVHFVGPKSPIVDGPYGKRLCVGPNYSNDTKYIVHQDSLGNTLPFGDVVMHPGQRVCGRWELRAPIGRFGYVVGTDTTWGLWFARKARRGWRREP